jgi:uncharacterized RDD family membrane protein YckC
MKCPKCQYISFDSGDRCRNCGYDFSLAPDAPRSAADDGDLPIQTGSEALGPLADFSLNEAPALPLFRSGTGDPDAPLVTPGAAPRAPLAVRRAAPAAPRPRVRRDNPPDEPRLALDTADMPVVPPRSVEAAVAAVNVGRDEPGEESAIPAAGAGARLAGGVVDLLLLGAIDVAIIYLTLRICELTFAQTLTLPLAPLISFLVLLNGGYLAAFVAASGQTIGKMAAGTRVVSADPGAPVNDRVSFEQAVLRAAASVLSALPLGLGFLPALVGRERRALHDRLADTRVVKA